MKSQCCTLSVFHLIRREMIVATTLSVLLLRRVHVLHVVLPDITSAGERACSRGFLKRFSALYPSQSG